MMIMIGLVQVEVGAQVVEGKDGGTVALGDRVQLATELPDGEARTALPAPHQQMYDGT
jgi:hypothetical protein